MFFISEKEKEKKRDKKILYNKKINEALGIKVKYSIQKSNI